jgi:hypothetical protein
MRKAIRGRGFGSHDDATGIRSRAVQTSQALHREKSLAEMRLSIVGVLS